MRRFTKAAVAFVFLAILVPIRGEVSREAGLFFVQSWSAKTYGASPQNWAIAQDRRGVMYFGNTDGLLEYDGVSWRKIKVMNGVGVRSLAVDGNGTIFVGAQRDFGYLQADANDDLEYVSLKNFVPEADRAFGDVFTIAPTPQGLYFGTFQRIFRWKSGTMKVWKPPAGSRYRLMMAGDVPYALIVKHGLFRLNRDEWQPVPGGDRFANEDVRAVYSISGSLRVITPGAIFEQAGATFEPLPSAASKDFEQDQIYTSRLLSSGDFAVGTNRGGLLIVNARGEIERRIGKNEGLTG